MQSHQAIIPFHRIPKCCTDCGQKMPDSERERRTHPFVCPEPHGPRNKPYLHFVSPSPTGIYMLFVRLKDGRLAVCLGRRANPDEVGFGKWALPGGFTEAETCAQAAVREFREEFDLDVSHLPQEHVHEYYDPASHCDNHFYAGMWNAETPPVLKTTSETSETWICPVDELPDDLAFPQQGEFICNAAERYAA